MGVGPVEGKTMNAVLAAGVAGSWNVAGIAVGKGFVIVTLASEALLLFVAAQAGFIDGPRVMANMAPDPWLPPPFPPPTHPLSLPHRPPFMPLTSLPMLPPPR